MTSPGPTPVLAPDVLELASLADRLRDRYASEKARWRGSPFEWILRLPSRQRGKVGEELVSYWCQARGFEVTTRTRGAEADRIIKGYRFEIKFSTLWESGTYRFQQLRDQDYEYVFCLGLSPFEAHAWVIPKRIAWENTSGQHGGHSGQDTHWLEVNPAAPPAWLEPWGGSLQRAYEVLKAI